MPWRWARREPVSYRATGFQDPTRKLRRQPASHTRWRRGHADGPMDHPTLGCRDRRGRALRARTLPAMMTMDFIVLIAVLLALVFVAAWASSRTLRAWIERPKYRFLADVEDYDRVVKK